jgi:hypothetical protein
VYPGCTQQLSITLTNIVKFPHWYRTRQISVKNPTDGQLATTKRLSLTGLAQPPVDWGLGHEPIPATSPRPFDLDVAHCVEGQDSLRDTLLLCRQLGTHDARGVIGGVHSLCQPY